MAPPFSVRVDFLSLPRNVQSVACPGGRPVVLMNRHVRCLSFRSRTKKGLTSWLTHPKARAHSGDQPLRPEAVVPRTVSRATDPVLLWPLWPEAAVPGPTAERSAPPAWPLRPEAVVPRNPRRAVVPVLLWPLRPEVVVPGPTAERSAPLACYDASRLLRPSATRSQRCASSRVRAVLTSVCRSSCCRRHDRLAALRSWPRGPAPIRPRRRGPPGSGLRASGRDDVAIQPLPGRLGRVIGQDIPVRIQSDH